MSTNEVMRESAPGIAEFKWNSWTGQSVLVCLASAEGEVNIDQLLKW